MAQLMQSAALLCRSVWEGVRPPAAAAASAQHSAILHLWRGEFSSSMVPFAAFITQHLRARPPGCRASSSRAVHLTPPRAGRARAWLDAWAVEGGFFFLSLHFFLSFSPSVS